MDFLCIQGHKLYFFVNSLCNIYFSFFFNDQSGQNSNFLHHPKCSLASKVYCVTMRKQSSTFSSHGFLSSCAHLPRHLYFVHTMCSHISNDFSWRWQVLHRGNYSQWYLASHCVWTPCHHMLLRCEKNMSSCSYLSFAGTKTKLTTDIVAPVNLTMFTWDWEQRIYLLSKPNSCHTEEQVGHSLFLCHFVL